MQITWNDQWGVEAIADHGWGWQFQSPLGGGSSGKGMLIYLLINIV